MDSGFALRPRPGMTAVQWAAFRRRFARKIPHSRHLQVTPPVRYGREGFERWRTDMLSIRIVTAGAVLAFAVSAAAAQDSDTTPGQPGSLLKMFMHSSEAPTSEANFATGQASKRNDIASQSRSERPGISTTTRPALRPRRKTRHRRPSRRRHQRQQSSNRQPWNRRHGRHRPPSTRRRRACGPRAMHRYSPACWTPSRKSLRLSRDRAAIAARQRRTRPPTHGPLQPSRPPSRTTATIAATPGS